MRSGQVLALKTVGHRHHDRARGGARRRRTAGAHEPDDVRRAARAGGVAAPRPARRRRRRDTSCSTPGRSGTVCARCRLRRPATSSSTWRATASRATCRSSISSVPSTCTATYRRVVGSRRRRGAACVRGIRRLSRSRSSSAIPDMHIYHYAAYEKTALRRLMSRHGTREEEVDRLLRNEVLVDLYRVVRQGIRLSTDSYSLKKVERLYMPAREESIADAAGKHGHVRALVDEPRGRWRRRRRRCSRRSRCTTSATASPPLQLRDWLEARRVEEEQLRGAPIERPPVIERDVERRARTRRSSRPRRSRPHWSTMSPRTRSCRPTPERARVVARAAALVSPAREQGELVASLRSDRDESRGARARHVCARTARDDRRARGRAAASSSGTGSSRRSTASASATNRSTRRPTRAGRPSSARSPSSTRRAGEITLSRTAGQAERGAVRFLIPSTPITTDAQEEALLDLGRWVAANGPDAPGPNRAGRDLLMRLPPRLRDGTPTASFAASARRRRRRRSV